MHEVTTSFRALMQYLESAEAYNQFHRSLCLYFLLKGAEDETKCADEVLGRVGEQIAEGRVIEDFKSYLHGVAKRVWLEERRAQGKRIQALVSPSFDERSLAQLDKCLDQLPAADRQIILSYYENESKRDVRASRFGISLKTFQNKASLIRKKLLQCLKRSGSFPSF